MLCTRQIFLQVSPHTSHVCINNANLLRRTCTMLLQQLQWFRLRTIVIRDLLSVNLAIQSLPCQVTIRDRCIDRCFRPNHLTTRSFWQNHPTHLRTYRRPCGESVGNSADLENVSMKRQLIGNILTTVDLSAPLKRCGIIAGSEAQNGSNLASVTILTFLIYAAVDGTKKPASCAANSAYIKQYSACLYSQATKKMQMTWANSLFSQLQLPARNYFCPTGTIGKKGEVGTWWGLEHSSLSKISVTVT